MKRKNYKYERRNEDVKRALSVLIRDEIKDPRVSPMTDVTGVDVTPDLQYCKVYVSALGGEEALARTIEGLKAASGFLRRELAQTVNLRHTPELQFIPDHSIEYGARMDALIRKVQEEDAKHHSEDEASLEEMDVSEASDAANVSGTETQE